jgi:hypothetical protein
VAEDGEPAVRRGEGGGFGGGFDLLGDLGVR